MRDFPEYLVPVRLTVFISVDSVTCELFAGGFDIRSLCNATLQVRDACRRRPRRCVCVAARAASLFTLDSCGSLASVVAGVASSVCVAASPTAARVVPRTLRPVACAVVGPVSCIACTS